MQLQVNLALAAFLFVTHISQPAVNETSTNSQVSTTQQATPLADVLVYCNNNTSVTFTVRMFNQGTATWYLFNAVPGGTNIGPVPEGTYNVFLYPNGGSSQYSFNGFCSFAATGYTVSWYSVAIVASGNCNQINITYW